VPALGLAGEVVVERDGAEEVRDRDSQLRRDRPEGLLREIPVALVESMENGEERGGLLEPPVEQRAIGCHALATSTTGFGTGLL
jgi:hypothetical protein